MDQNLEGFSLAVTDVQEAQLANILRDAFQKMHAVCPVLDSFLVIPCAKLTVDGVPCYWRISSPNEEGIMTALAATYTITALANINEMLCAKLTAEVVALHNLGVDKVREMMKGALDEQKEEGTAAT